MKKNVLIIGGSGFVGSTLVRSLKDDDWNVTLLNRGNRPMVGTTQLIADRNEALAVQKAAEGTERFDAVIETSAYNQNHAKIAWDAFSQKTDHWIHLGSASVYKETPGRHPSETDEIGGAAVWAEYGVEKSEADIFLLNNAGICLPNFRDCTSGCSARASVRQHRPKRFLKSFSSTMRFD